MRLSIRQRFYLPQAHGSRWQGIILIAGLISLLSILSAQLIKTQHDTGAGAVPQHAIAIMQQALNTIIAFCDSAGVPIDMEIDPNRTGLIGPELSPIATTLGNLEAKRTTTNPAFAALMVDLLQRAGVAPEDTIAVGCSGSFPALMIATLAAAKALSIHPIIILSLGSSSFGASNPDFNLLHIFEMLFRKNIFTVAPRAISLGGDADVGNDFDPEIKAKLIQQIKHSGFELLYELDLEKNVARRMEIYFGPSAGARIAAFINIGANYANIGTSELVLKLRPGLNRPKTLPARAERGVLFEMASLKIPIIHLLYIKGLAFDYGLPWDPVPLPSLSLVPLIKTTRPRSSFVVFTGIYLATITGLLIYGTIRQRRSIG